MTHVQDKVRKKLTARQWNRYLAVTEYTERRLTFGMHTGKMIKDLPLDYLKWGVLNLDDLWADYFSRELQRRKPNYKL